MLKIYLKNKKKLGYIYFSFQEGEIKFINKIREFDHPSKMESYITAAKLDVVKFQMDAFISTYIKYNESNNDIDSKSLDTLQRLSHWMNDGDKELQKVYRQIEKRKEEFVSLIKSTKIMKGDLIMIYKLMFEEVTKDNNGKDN